VWSGLGPRQRSEEHLCGLRLSRAVPPASAALFRGVSTLRGANRHLSALLLDQSSSPSRLLRGSVRRSARRLASGERRSSPRALCLQTMSHFRAASPAFGESAPPPPQPRRDVSSSTNRRSTSVLRGTPPLALARPEAPRRLVGFEAGCPPDSEESFGRPALRFRAPPGLLGRLPTLGLAPRSAAEVR